MPRRRRRTIAVTGSASGIGRSIRDHAEAVGWHVIGVDIRDAEVLADLSSPQGRAVAVSQVIDRTRGQLDGLALCAGIRIGDDAKEVALNYFGVSDPLIALRESLAAGSDAAVVVITSFALLSPLCAREIVDACLRGDEPDAVAQARQRPQSGYASSKLALAKLVRQLAPTTEWAGAGITVNGVAPGLIRTALTAAVLADPIELAKVEQVIPLTMGRIGEPEDVAATVMALLSPALRYVTGQLIFVDGGAEASIRPNDIFTPAGQAYRFGADRRPSVTSTDGP